MSEVHQFVRVDFHRFKALERFVLHLRHFNILVGPNNAGKSTILAAFRILAAALRTASSRNPRVVRGPRGNTFGHFINLTGVSVAEENIFFNYDDSKAAAVVFTLSNGNVLRLYFPEKDSCYLIPESKGTARRIETGRRHSGSGQILFTRPTTKPMKQWRSSRNAFCERS